MQASEKYYKAVEEAIKILSRKSNLSVLKRLRHGRWSSELLFDAVHELGIDEIKEIWYIAWELHIDGFHEMKLTEERLRLVKDKIRKILDYL
ncbi:MAG: PaREP1 family protein [Sulfolobales archaeon]